MERWHLPSVTASGKRSPRVLLSSRECRAVLIDLEAGDELGEHSLHERAVVQVVAGAVIVSSDGGESRCEAGTLVSFEPGERHAVRADASARILLLLAPWPGEGHYDEGERHRAPEHTPANATARPE
jgi:quercetin dioxygenase-like cupin family protein